MVQLCLFGEPLYALHQLVHRHPPTCLAGLEDGHARIVRFQIGKAIAVRDDEAQAAGVHQVAIPVSRPGLVPVEVFTGHPSASLIRAIELDQTWPPRIFAGLGLGW